MNYGWLRLTVSIFFTFCCVFAVSSEIFIDYGDLSKIELNMNKDDVVSILGEPVLLLADSEYDNAVYLLYNYKIKQFEISGGNIDLGSKNYKNARSILLKLTFVDNKLMSWEEDKVTLSMATHKPKKGGGIIFQYFSLLLNLILLIKII
jgi:outer membrane protein assembly factor BamE (lipoprotein component of BamABCDE complex)